MSLTIQQIAEHKWFPHVRAAHENFAVANGVSATHWSDVGMDDPMVKSIRAINEVAAPTCRALIMLGVDRATLYKQVCDAGLPVTLPEPAFVANELSMQQ